VSSRRVVAVLRKLPLSRGVISVRGRGEHNASWRLRQWPLSASIASGARSVDQ